MTLGAFDYNISGPDGFHPPGISSWYAETGAELGPMLFLEAVPEPMSCLLLAMGGMVLVTGWRRSSGKEPLASMQPLADKGADAYEWKPVNAVLCPQSR